MFTSSPRFATLGRQVAQDLAGRIARGEFGASLPGERWLAESLQVSRRTVRAALALLRDDQLLATVRGRETRVVRAQAAPRGARSVPSVGLLLPAPIDQLEPYSTVFFDPLRGQLLEAGYRLEIHAGPSFFSQRPGAALAKLAARFPCDAWILAFSNRACQSWFHAQRLPAVIVGTAHDGVALPFVDVDHRATARHAASHLLSLGHRRLALIINEKNRAGDRLTEEGFLAGVRASTDRSADAAILRHDATMDGLRRLTDRMLALAQRPTALFIANPYHYLGVAGLLAERGVKVPRDISLLCRDDDFCLRYMPVEPGRYLCHPEKRARATFAAVMRLLRARRAGGAPKSTLLAPELLPGASVRRLVARR